MDIESSGSWTWNFSFMFFSFFIRFLKNTFNCFLNYETMVTYLQETWKIQNKVTYSSTIYYTYFLSRLITIFSWSFNIKLSKINRVDRQKSNLKSTMNQFNIIMINRIFTQQWGKNPIQVPIDYKSGDTGIYPGT